MEPNEHEAESKLVAQHIRYIFRQTGETCPKWILLAAGAEYGNPNKVHELTAYLCRICKNMPKATADYVMYDGRKAEARALADWWEAHKKADAEKYQRLIEEARANKLKQKELAKLSPRTRKILGI